MSDQHEFNGISGVCCVVWPNGFSAGAPRVCGKYKTDPIHSPAPAQEATSGRVQEIMAFFPPLTPETERRVRADISAIVLRAQEVAATPEREPQPDVLWEMDKQLQLAMAEVERLKAERDELEGCLATSQALVAKLRDQRDRKSKAWRIAFDESNRRTVDLALASARVEQLERLLRRGARTEWAEGDLSRHTWRAWVAEVEQALGEEKA